MWCIQKMDSEFVERMYDILDLYTAPYDPMRPVIGMDEKHKQLLEDSRKSIPMKPETRKNMTMNIREREKLIFFFAWNQKRERE